MSTPERPLTRRQLREIRRTGQLPVVGADEATDENPAADSPADAGERASAAPADAPGGADAPAVSSDADATGADRAAAEATEPAAEPASGAPAEAEEDSGTEASSGPQRPLTRRELRMQRMRTSQIAVVASDDGDAPDDAVTDESLAPHPAARMEIGFDGAGTVDDDAENETAELVTEEQPAEAQPPAAEEAVLEEVVDDTPAQPEPVERADAAEQAEPAETAPDGDPTATAAGEANTQAPQVGASFGAAVFRQAEERQRQEREQAEREAAERREAKEQAEAPKAAAPRGAEAPKPSSAEPKSDTGELAAEAFQRSMGPSGSTAGNTSSLILKDMPGTASLNAPITATGELILTSSHTLPAGLGTHGAAAGTTDGREIDELLLDGEIPQHSSPTPIAASSAVSTSKAPGEVIRPPAPEKNHGLMLTLGITAGVLGVALIGVVVYVFATGALN